MEAINEAQRVEKIFNSEKLHKEEDFPKAIYTEWKSPHYSERWCCTRVLNTVEYNWKVNAVPLLTKLLGIIAIGLSIIVIGLEVGLYFNY